MFGALDDNHSIVAMHFFKVPGRGLVQNPRSHCLSWLYRPSHGL